MGRGIHKLSTAALKRNKPGDYGDGGGLLLQVTKGTSGQVRRSWIYRYAIGGRRREMGLGSAAIVSLAEARELAVQCRRQRHQGVDPIEARNTDRAARTAAAARTATFDECVGAYLAAHRDAWRSHKHAKQWDGSLRRSISPVLGKLPVAQIDTAMLVKALRPLWERTPTTASRVRGRIEAILDWATVSGFRQGENPARWGGHLQHLLPAARKLAPIVHHAALPYRTVPALMAELCRSDSIVARVFELVVLTASRSGEVRGMEWSEVDFADRVWTIPGNRMKAGRTHRVPLSPRAIAILEGQRGRSKQLRGVVFPGRGGVQVSDSALRYLLKSLGYDGVTVHGFRSAFRDWAGEQTNFAREVAEGALAHHVGNATERAYRRADALEKRRRLMAAWSDYCSKPPPTGATGPPCIERGVKLMAGKPKAKRGRPTMSAEQRFKRNSAPCSSGRGVVYSRRA